MTDYRGLLTETDRLYLKGQKQYSSKQQRYDRRKSIRERTRGAFRDFALLFDELDSTERNKIFNPPAEDAPELWDSMIKTVGFLYHALEGDAGSNAARGTFRHPFDQLLKGGVRVGNLRRHEADEGGPWEGKTDIEFNVKETHPGVAEQSRVVDALARNHGRGLTDDEIRTTVIHAARETVEDDNFTTVDGEPVEEYFDHPVFGLRGLAEQVEQRAKELREDVEE